MTPDAAMTYDLLRAVVNEIRRLHCRCMKKDGSETDYNRGLDAARIAVEKMIENPKALEEAMSRWKEASEWAR